jgi:hypothetical protein
MVYTQQINFALMTFRLENLKEGEHLEDLASNGRRILKYALRKYIYEGMDCILADPGGRAV